MSAKSIRYYEQTGLINAAARSDTGYRQFDVRDVHTLRFVRRTRRLGFSIPQLGELLALWCDRHRSSAEVEEITMAHTVELQLKITEMQFMVDTLEDLASRCDGNERPDYPILVELQGGDL